MPGTWYIRSIFFTDKLNLPVYTRHSYTDIVRDILPHDDRGGGGGDWRIQQAHRVCPCELVEQTDRPQQQQDSRLRLPSGLGGECG